MSYMQNKNLLLLSKDGKLNKNIIYNVLNNIIDRKYTVSICESNTTESMYIKITWMQDTVTFRISTHLKGNNKRERFTMKTLVVKKRTCVKTLENFIDNRIEFLKKRVVSNSFKRI